MRVPSVFNAFAARFPLSGQIFLNISALIRLFAIDGSVINFGEVLLEACVNTLTLGQSTEISLFH